MYKVICRFADLQDSSTIYEVGDTYPREGYEPAAERIVELSGSKNKIGKPLIIEEKEVETVNKSVKKRKKEQDIN